MHEEMFDGSSLFYRGHSGIGNLPPFAWVGCSRMNESQSLFIGD